ncbi:MAG: nuclear transport factor 2 family protein [Cyanobacteria bacterium P01_F01_bin.143]
MANNVEAEIIDLEARLKTAMLDSNIEELNKLISDQLIFTDHLGRVLSKDDDLEAHKSGELNIDKIELSEQVIKCFGDLAVVSVLAEITGSYKGVLSEGIYRFTRIWTKEAGQWKIITAHSSALTQK